MRIVERFSERERTRIALIWGLGLFLLYTLVIAPFFAAQRTAAEAERAAAEAFLARVELHERTLIAEPQTEQKLRARQAFLLHALPDEEEQGSFIRTVERLARQNNVVLAHFAPQPPVHMEEIVISRPRSASSNSSGRVTPMRLAMISRNLPVPAEHLSFI